MDKIVKLIGGLCLLCIVNVVSAQDTLGVQWMRKPLKLTGELTESSGLFLTREGIWTFNDSGGKAEIYLIDTITGEIKRSVPIRQANNKDWEAATTDSKNLYIGDIGNNTGNRSDLSVYKLKMPNKTDTILSPLSEIKFQWPKVMYGESNDDNHDRDSESMIVMQDTLFLITKARNSKVASLAYLNKKSPQIINIVDSIETGFLVTDAAYTVINGVPVLAILGYESINTAEIWVWFFTGKKGSQAFKGSLIKKRIGNLLMLGQTEGLCFLNKDTLVISAEQFGLQTSAVLHFLDIRFLFWY